MENPNLTPEEKAALEAAKAEQVAKEKAEAKTKAEQKAKEKAEAAAKAKAEKEANNSELNEKIKNAFENFPTANKLYHDGKEVFFTQVKIEMTVVKRADFVNEPLKQE
jgi:flagellar biosynthesis/type III secretory pathway protein FliH